MSEPTTLAEARRARPRQNRDERIPPHNLDAEASLLGALLLSPTNTWEAIGNVVTADDFYKPAHQHIYRAMRQLAQAYEPVDVVTVVDTLRRSGLLDDVGGPAALLELQAVTPVISNANRYAKIVLGTSQRRALAWAAAQIGEWAFDEPDDPTEQGSTAIFDRARQHLTDLQTRMSRLSMETHTPRITDITAEAWAPPEWTIPGQLQRGDRLIVLGAASRGKTTFVRQLLTFAAGGLHPYRGDMSRTYPLFGAEPAVTMRCLVVDLENSRRQWNRQTKPMVDFVCHRTGRTELDLFVHATGGAKFDPVNSASDRAELVMRMQEVRPDILFFGPIYKTETTEDWKNDARKLQELLDDLRAAFNCSVIMEAHTGRTGKHQRGAADWEYWPELVKRLERSKDDDTLRNIENGRVPREEDVYRYWPTQVAWHNRVMPLRAIWPKNTWLGDGDPRPAYDRHPDWENQRDDEPF